MKLSCNGRNNLFCPGVRKYHPCSKTMSPLEHQTAGIKYRKNTYDSSKKIHQVNLAWPKIPCKQQSSSNKAFNAIFYSILKSKLRQNDLGKNLVRQKTACEPKSETNYQDITPVVKLERFPKCSSSRCLSRTQY